MRMELSRPRLLVAACGLAVALLPACASRSGGAAEKPEPEQVDVGYGTQPRTAVTSSVSSISEEDFKNTHVTRIEQLLERIPGVQVLRGSGGDFTVRIRGTSSLMGDNEPLLVLDGTPISGGLRSALAGLSPADVARIDVLKDAGSTAIYGVQGANGVIVITTKRAR
jgi:TonB-dependent SusC/RagA subfamily outer membrane receptor